MKNFAICLLSIILIACNSQPKNQEVQITETVNSNKDSILVEENLSEEVVSNQNIVIDTDNYYSFIELAGDTISDFNTYKLKDFTRIKNGENHFKYYLLRNLKIYDSILTYLIAEDYESEEACWLVNYDDDMNVISSFEVYYDNAEGAWNTTSQINEEKGTMRVRTYDAYADPTEKIDWYQIDQNGKIVKGKNN